MEPGFLVQGTLRSEKVGGATRRREDGPRLMRRGDVGWAGEGPGPDFFVYVGREAGGALREAEHTVFAEVADDDVDGDAGARGANAPSSTPGGTGTMRFIDERPKISLRAYARVRRIAPRARRSRVEDAPRRGV